MDIRKAFNSLDLNFTLEKYGFWKDFMLWVRNFLRDQESCDANSGTTTKYFSLQIGAYQRHPIPAFLFIFSFRYVIYSYKIRT